MGCGSAQCDDFIHTPRSMMPGTYMTSVLGTGAGQDGHGGHRELPDVEKRETTQWMWATADTTGACTACEEIKMERNGWPGW